MLDFETFSIRVKKVQGINVKGWEWSTSDSNLFPNGHWPQNHPYEKAAWLGLWNFRIIEGRKGLLSCLTLGPVGKTPCFICWGEWKLISVTPRLAPWHLSKVPVEAQNQLRGKVKPAGGHQRKEVDCPLRWADKGSPAFLSCVLFAFSESTSWFPSHTCQIKSYLSLNDTGKFVLNLVSRRKRSFVIVSIYFPGHR